MHLGFLQSGFCLCYTKKRVQRLKLHEVSVFPEKFEEDLWLVFVFSECLQSKP